MFRFAALLALIPLLYMCSSTGQKKDLTVTVRNQPDQKVILGRISGDRFIPIDSLMPDQFKRSGKEAVFSFDLAGEYPPGIYRIVLGRSSYSRTMNEPPRHIDVILNREEVVLFTDFTKPEDSLKVIRSEENRIWLEFKNREKKYQQRLRELVTELDYGHSRGVLPEKKVEAYNRLQRDREQFIVECAGMDTGMVSCRLIGLYREPFLDGNLPPEQRREIFRREYFRNLDFTDERWIYSPVYTDRVFKYLLSHAQRGLSVEAQDLEFRKAVDMIISATRGNDTVYEFILDYLVRGFERLNLESLIAYIAVKYAATTCQTDEKTTLERRLGERLMTVGSTIADFTLTDVNGDPVTLSEVVKEQTLILFWASWCPHCVEIIPGIKHALEMADRQNTEVVAISVDTSREEWLSKVSGLRMESWFNLSDMKGWDGAVAESCNVYATPTFLMVDRELKITAKPQNVDELILLFKR